MLHRSGIFCDVEKKFIEKIGTSSVGQANGALQMTN